MFKYDLGQKVWFYDKQLTKRIGIVIGHIQKPYNSIQQNAYDILVGGTTYHNTSEFDIYDCEEKTGAIPNPKFKIGEIVRHAMIVGMISSYRWSDGIWYYNIRGNDGTILNNAKEHQLQSLTPKGFQMPIQDEPTMAYTNKAIEEACKRLMDIKPPKIMTITTNPSEPNPFKYYHLSPDDCVLDAIKYAFTPTFLDKVTKSRTQPKNRIPDRVIFNKAKGKTTLLFSVENNGVAPYEAYTSKVNDDVDYCKHTGFYVTYFKYFNRNLTPKELKARINRFYQFKEESNVLVALCAIADNEILKIVSREQWTDIYTTIFETGNNGTWGYTEWKEMLRVHEIETAKEAKKKLYKEIKVHEQEIKKLKDGVKNNGLK